MDQLLVKNFLQVELVVVRDQPRQTSRDTAAFDRQDMTTCRTGST